MGSEGRIKSGCENVQHIINLLIFETWQTHLLGFNQGKHIKQRTQEKVQQNIT